MKNFFLFLAIIGISVSSVNAATRPSLGPISITPLGSGIITTNTPVSGQTLFSGGGSIYYWDWATNSPATNIVLTGTVFKNAGSTAAFIANAGIYSTNFSVESVNYISNLTYQVILTAAFANDTIVSNGLITYVGNSTNLAYGYSRTIGAAGTNDVIGRFLSSTNLATTVHQGFVPALANDVTKFFDSTGNYSVPAGSGGAATNAIANVYSNNVSQVTGATSLDFWNGANLSIGPITNRTGHVDVPFSLSQTLTNLISESFVGGGIIQGLSGATASGSFNRVAAGITNGFINTWNVIDFGASPALSDNSTAIQNALNTASTNGGRVFIPAATNTYTCTSTINIPDGVTLFGDTVPYGGGNGNASQIYNSSSAVILTFGNGCVVKNILIQGSGVNGTQIGVANRYTTVGISGYQFEGNLIKNLAVGIVLSNTWDGFFPNNVVSACQRSVVFSNYANSITFLCGHYGSSGYGTAIGFDVRGDDLQQKSNLSFIGCVMEVSSNSFCLRGGGGGWDNINISGYGEGSTNVIYASGGLNLNIDHISFVQSGGTATTNIVLRGVKQVAMDHCYFFNSVAFDADSATFGLSFEKNYVESGVTWNDRSTTSIINDNTNLVLKGGSYYGNGSGITNIPLSGLAQSGATASQFPQWNGSAWVPVTVTSSSTTNGYLANTNFISGKFYTNTLGGPIYVGVNANYHVSTVAGQASVALWTSSTTNSVGATGSTLDASAHDYTNILSGWVAANEWYIFTNLLSGSGDTVTLFGGQIAMPSGTNLTGIQSIVGTANQITASTTAGVTTLSTPSVFVAPGSVTATTVINGTGSGITNADVHTLLTNVGPYSVVANNGSAAANALIIPVSQTAVFASSTNSVQLAPLLFGTNWLLQSATPCNITNAINGTAGYIFAADITISNSSAATFTTRVDTAWIPRGWLATNIGTGTLGFNGVTVAAAKEAFIHVEARGTIETNYWLSY